MSGSKLFIRSRDIISALSSLPLILIAYSYSNIEVTAGEIGSQKVEQKKIISKTIHSVLRPGGKKCIIASEWMSPDLSSDLYKNYIGSKAIPPLEYSKFIEPKDFFSEKGEILENWLCSDRDANAHLTRLIEHIKSANHTWKDDDSAYETEYFERYALSKPIFKSDRKTAVIWVKHKKYTFIRTWNKNENVPSRIYDKNGFSQLAVEGDKRAYIYKKIRGEWRITQEHIESVYN